MKKQTIVTHDGVFHADEVTACMILKTLFPNTIITRTRIQDIITEADFVVDVGKIYDPTKNKFDHHQQDCLEYLIDDNKWIPLSSAGMVYKKYGKQFLKTFYQIDNIDDLNEIYKQFYNGFIQEIDAVDNGMKQCEGNLKYWVCTGISTMINRLNSENIYNDNDQLIRFQEAMEYAYYSAKIILRSIYQRHQTLKNDYNIIVEAFKTRSEIDDTGQILLLKSDCSNWQKCLCEYEKKNGIEGEIKFVIYRNNKEWRIKTISNTFSSRKNILPADILSKHLSKPSDLTFVHNKLFLASSKTFGTAVEIGKLSLLG